MATSNASGPGFDHFITPQWMPLRGLSQPIADLLSLPALPFHIHQILFMTGCYQVLYKYILPAISSKLSPVRYPKLSNSLKVDWDVCALSLEQSLINSSLAIWLLLVNDPQTKMNWQERIWGYQPVTGSVLGYSTGYFVWHLGQAIAHRHIKGWVFVLHGIACLVLCGLGFRPFALCYTPAFLIMEVPNIFLNIQKFHDKNGLRNSRSRAYNRYTLLTTYLFCRLIPGIYSQYLMFRDISKAVRETHPSIPAKYLLRGPNTKVISDTESLYIVQPLPMWIACIQLFSISVLNLQGLHWFRQLIKSSFYTPGLTPGPSGKQAIPNVLSQPVLEKAVEGHTITGSETRAGVDGRKLDHQGDPTMPIAIIGLGCRFAGDATTPERLWEMCATGRDAWSEIPADRFNQKAFYHPNGAREGSTNVRGAHFLKEDISLFDAPFFNITLEEAKAMDPQLRLQLECTYEALENAGIGLQSIAKTDTSVYSGIFARDYHESLLRDIETLPRYFNTGNGAAMFSNRLSYFFDLKGPSMTVDTGCSTSIVALHLACQSLRTGESKISIVGGNNIILTPDMITAMSSFGFVSPDGRSYAFDHRASGYGRGEGIASIIIKPLKDALRDGDPIRAVIRQTYLNQDGKTAGITLPSQDAQEALIRSCYNTAGLDPAETTYIEAHGTGTQAGDPLEAGAIASVFGQNRTSNNPVYIGSVKTNIGHLEAGSGLAGIIKAVLVLEKGLIPPSANFEKANAKLRLSSWGMKVPIELEKWPANALRRVSVNSFGYGGTNGHVIMEHINDFQSRNNRESLHMNQKVTMDSRADPADAVDESSRLNRRRLFTISAKADDSVQNIRSNLSRYLKQHVGLNEEQFLDNLAYTLAERRTPFPWVATTTACCVQELIDELGDSKLRVARREENVKLGFVFTGQGSQWHAMGRELFSAYPVFRDSILAADKHMRILGADWSILDELHKDAKSSRVNDAVYSQPLCTALQVSLVRLLASWDIKPAAVTSHSSGEVAAAYAAGALSLESAITVSYFRGLLTTRIQINSPGLQGGMIAVGLSQEDAETYIQRITSGKVVVGCVNSPTSVTVSGDVDGIVELQKLLEDDDIFVRRLQVNAGYHSHHMQVIAKDYKAVLQKHHFKPENWVGDIAFSSSVTGQYIVASDHFGVDYWVENMCQPVLFTDALRNMCLGSSPHKALVDVMIEIGPHSGLSGPIRQILKLPQLKEMSVMYSSCLIRKEDAVKTMQEMVCSLIAKGYRVNLKAINFPQSNKNLRVVTDLPSYPWSHKIRHWHESHLNRRHRLRDGGPHDLLGVPAPNSNPLAPTWRHIVRLSDIPWVRDHVIQGSFIYPAAGYVAMAVEGFRQANAGSQNITAFKLRHVDVLTAAVIPDTPQGIELQLSLRPAADKLPSAQGWLEFNVYSISPSESLEWTKHCTGFISAEFSLASEETGWTSASSSSKSKFSAVLNSEEAKFQSHDPKQVYEMLRAEGIHHGPAFQNLETIFISHNQSIGTISVPDTASLMPYKYEHDHIIHPTTLDTILQSMYPAVPVNKGKKITMLPRFFKSVSIANIGSTPGQRLKVWSIIEKNSTKSVTSSIRAADESNFELPLLVEIQGFRCDSLGTATESNDNNERRKLCFQMHWDYDFSFLKSNWYDGSETDSEICKIVALHTHKYPGAKYLTINTSSGEFMTSMLKSLTGREGERPRISHYDFTHQFSGFAESAPKEFQDWDDLISLKTFDVEADLAQQGWDNSSYDLIIVQGISLSDPANKIDAALTNIHKLLRPDASVLIVIEGLANNQNYLHVKELLERNGLQSSKVPIQIPQDRLTPSIILQATRSETRNSSLHSLKVSIVYGSTQPPKAWVRALESSLESLSGLSPTGGSLEEVDGTGKVCIVLAELVQPLLSCLSPNQFLALRNLLMSAEGVLWVTRGGAVECDTPEASLVTGLLRVLRSENPGTKFVTLDLDPQLEAFAPESTRIILEVFENAFKSKSEESFVDWEYAHRGGGLMIPRLVEDERTDDAISIQSHDLVPQHQPFYQKNRPLRMEIAIPGLIDSLRFVDDPTIEEDLPDSFIELEPKAFGLNFRDVMVAMGHLDETVMGYECSGVITRVGERVPSKIKVGQRVCAMMKGSYANLVRVPWETIGEIPDDMPFDVAASLPMVFCTAHYCLYNTARLEKGETILIHAAAGGVGQAAIMLAQLVGAEIFVTVGTEEKRKFIIETYGISADHVFSSRNTSFAKGIMSATNERGVDVVLNCLAAEMLQETWNCIAMLGRFVEIGKRDIELNNHLEMAPFTRNVSFSSIDLTYVMKHKASVLSKILTDVMDLLKVGKIQPVKPVTVFPISEIERAFRLMQSGKHRGKVIIEPRPDDQVKVLPKRPSAQFHDSASYLIVGGTGGIGKSISRWLVKQGVKHLVLISRGGLTRLPARELQEELTEAGCDVAIYSCDITDEAQLRRVVQKCEQFMPPIRGVIQAAMALSDCVFEQMPYSSYIEALQPKVQGTWNLDKQFANDIDFFIMLSSAAGIGGNRGQANYAAGSTFLDAIARHRASRGMPGVALDLGVIQDVGYVAENKDLATRLERLGHVAIKEKELLSMIESAITDPIRDPTSSQIVSGFGTGQTESPWFNDLKFSRFHQDNDSSTPRTDSNKAGLSDQLMAANTLPEAVDIITKAIAKKLAQDFMIAEEGMNLDESLGSYGVDSLVAVELRNWIIRQMKADTSIFDVLQSQSLRALAEKVAVKSEYVKLGGV